MPDNAPGSAALPAPGSWFLLRVWLLLSLQSFGGGGATLSLLRRAIVEQHGWISEADFTRDWAICQVCPGINLLCMTILVGRRIAGLRGVFLCLVGLLVPSVTATILLTAFYARIRNAAQVQAALRAVVPASVGLGLLAAWDMLRPLLRESKQDGAVWVIFAAFLLVASGAALWFNAPVVAILAGAGLLSGVLHFAAQRTPEP